MNPDDDNNPNSFLPDNELNFIQMPYPGRVLRISLEQEAPSHNYGRIFIAIIMVLLMLFSVSYMLLQSWIQERNTPSVAQSLDDFDVILTGISTTTTTDCQNAPHVILGGTNAPTRRLCICGSLYTDESTVNYILRLRDVRGNILERTEKSNQKAGPFCQLWQFPNTLHEGRYAIEIASGRNSPPLVIMWITIATQSF